MKCSVLILCLAALLPKVVSGAQLAAPNEAGVAMGHVHLTVRDLEASRNLWIELGGTPEKKFANDEVIRISGILIILKEAEPSGGSAGSVVNHISIRVPNFQESMAKWQAAGIKTERDWRPAVGWVITPDDLRIEVSEDAKLIVPIAMAHLGFSLDESSIPKMKAWYIATFGAKLEKAGQTEFVVIPGGHLNFLKSDTATVPTKGRTLDHIGFEIKDLEAFCKKLEASGVKLDRPYTKRPDLGIALAFITDPWGTYIDLTEGLDTR